MRGCLVLVLMLLLPVAVVGGGLWLVRADAAAAVSEQPGIATVLGVSVDGIGWSSGLAVDCSVTAMTASTATASAVLLRQRVQWRSSPWRQVVRMP